MEYLIDKYGTFSVICEGIHAKQSNPVSKIKSLINSFNFTNTFYLGDVKYGGFLRISSFRFTIVSSLDNSKSLNLIVLVADTRIYYASDGNEMAIRGAITKEENK